jgi:hypothetical protein
MAQTEHPSTMEKARTMPIGTGAYPASMLREATADILTGRAVSRTSRNTPG